MLPTGRPISEYAADADWFSGRIWNNKLNKDTVLSDKTIQSWTCIHKTNHKFAVVYKAVIMAGFASITQAPWGGSTLHG